jgi:hypothetical protein
MMRYIAVFLFVVTCVLPLAIARGGSASPYGDEKEGTLLFDMSKDDVEVPLGDIVGLWQYPNRRVWVLVQANGSAFQCRDAPSGKFFTSEGRYVPIRSIQWNEIWGTDKVSVRDGAMALEGKFGTFAYSKAKDPMDEGCRASH